MLGELESARVKGLAFEEFQKEIIRLVKHFISDSYCKYPMLKEFGIDMEEVEIVVYNSLYNRKDKSALSNIERYFIKASEMSEPGKIYGKDTKYLVSIIKKVVGTSFSWLCRNLLRKGHQPPVSLEGCCIDKYEGISELYDRLHYEDVLKQVPLVKYPYIVKVNGSEKKLNSRLLLDLIVIGYQRKDLLKMIYSVDSNELISQAQFCELRSSVIRLAKRSLKDFT